MRSAYDSGAAVYEGGVSRPDAKRIAVFSAKDKNVVKGEGGAVMGWVDTRCSATQQDDYFKRKKANNLSMKSVVSSIKDV